MKCEAINCKNEAKHTFILIIHSNIFSGVFKLDNKTKAFNLCTEHYKQAIIASRKK